MDASQLRDECEATAAAAAAQRADERNKQQEKEKKKENAARRQNEDCAKFTGESVGTAREAADGL